MSTATTHKSGIGAPVQRVEDERLLRGHGRFTDDITAPGTTFAEIVRSFHAHARIRGIDKRAALAAPGVLAVLTGEDVVNEKLAGLVCGTFPRQTSGTRSYCPDQPILVPDKVRYVGDRVAVVVAETLAQAKNAAELLEIDYEPLPAVTLVDALVPGAPKVWDEAVGNVSFQREWGDRRAVDELFAGAAHVTKVRVHYPRAAPNTMEPRAALAYVDPTDNRITIYCATQHPFWVRETASHVLGVPETSLRIITGDVGGSFGMKSVFPEEILIAWSAAKVRRPVKWTASRSESIASDSHGRHQIAEAELALDTDGQILAFRTNVTIDIGAYLTHSAGIPPNNAGISYPGTYRVPHIHALVRAVFTNSTLLSVYRGSGKPEASFVLEHLVEKAAREMRIDPIDLRRRNLIRPSDMPYKTPAVYTYDCGNFGQNLDKCLALADWNSFAERRARSEALGLRRGIGVGMHCQRAGHSSERMEIRVDATGVISIYAGTLSTGQGHETMFAQMVSEWLGVPLGDVRVFQGDTDKVLYGRGSYAQRSMSTGGSALKVAADEVVRKAKGFAAWMMEVAELDVVLEGGVFRVAGTDRQLTWREVARQSYSDFGVPAELGIGLDAVGTHAGPNTYPNGCIIAEVEVDPETGVIKIDQISSVDDAGVPINPLALDGQLHGSLAQAIGEMLMETVVYERELGTIAHRLFHGLRHATRRQHAGNRGRACSSADPGQPARHQRRQ